MIYWSAFLLLQFSSFSLGFAHGSVSRYLSFQQADFLESIMQIMGRHDI